MFIQALQNSLGRYIDIWSSKELLDHAVHLLCCELLACQLYSKHGQIVALIHTLEQAISVEYELSELVKYH